MRKPIYLVLITILIMLSFTPASAAVPNSYLSTVNVTNVSDVDAAIDMVFYDKNGVVKATITEDVAAYETKWFSSFTGLASGFDGSMVISSNVPLASMSMLSGLDSSKNSKNYASFIGTSAGSSTVFLPLLMKNNYGYSTYFYVQNTSGSPVNVNVEYSDGTNATITGLAPNASKKIDNRTESHPAKDFSATLVATGEIAVAVVEYSDGSKGEQLYAYSGFSSGSTNPVFAMVNENNYGYWTSVNIQNMGDEATTVTLSYAPSEAGKACTETQTIPAGAKRDFATYAFAFDPTIYPHTLTTNCALYSRFIGGAVVTQNSANQDLVGIVNQINMGNDPNKGGALMSLNPSTASDTVVYPYIRQWVGRQQWWSSTTIINVSGSPIEANDIECRLVGTDNSGDVDLVLSNPKRLVDGGAWLHQFYKDRAPLGNGFQGGAVCTTKSGKEIVGAANILADGTGMLIDSLAVYEGINPGITLVD